MDIVHAGLSCCLLLIFSSNIRCSTDCHPIDQCSCKLDNGQIISLWEIDKGTGEGYTAKDAEQRKFTYYYSPCTGLKFPGTECNGALGCQTSGSDSFAFALNKGPVSTAYDTVGGNYMFIYSGSATKLSSDRITSITLSCDPGIETPTVGDVLESPTGQYAFSITTKCACPGKCKYSPKKHSSASASSSKLSTGSILLIVCFVLLIVYVIGGILISKYALHKEGAEIVPNREFWKDLPSLIKDGYMFTYHKVSGQKKEYEVIT